MGAGGGLVIVWSGQGVSRSRSLTDMTHTADSYLMQEFHLNGSMVLFFWGGGRGKVFLRLACHVSDRPLSLFGPFPFGCLLFPGLVHNYLPNLGSDESFNTRGPKQTPLSQGRICAICNTNRWSDSMRPSQSRSMFYSCSYSCCSFWEISLSC